MTDGTSTQFDAIEALTGKPIAAYSVSTLDDVSAACDVSSCWSVDTVDSSEETSDNRVVI